MGVFFMRTFNGRCTIDGIIFLIYAYLRTNKTTTDGEGSVVSIRRNYEFLKENGLDPANLISSEFLRAIPTASLELYKTYGVTGTVSDETEREKERRFSASLRVVKKEDISNDLVFHDLNIQYFVYIIKWEWEK